MTNNVKSLNDIVTKESKGIFHLMVSKRAQFPLMKGFGMTNLLGVPLAMLTRFFNKEICIEHKAKSMGNVSMMKDHNFLHHANEGKTSE